MCNAMAIGMILKGVGGGLQTHAGLREGLAKAQQQRYQSQIASNNAFMAGEEARLIKEEGFTAQQNVDLQTNQVRGIGRSAIASSNVVVDQDSALTWDLDLAESAARDKWQIQRQTDLDVWQKEQEQQNFLAESKMLKRASKQSKRNARMTAVGGLLQTAGSMVGGMGGK